MPYKDYKKAKERARDYYWENRETRLKYYQDNKERTLEYQKRRWKEKYANDKTFRDKKLFRLKSQRLFNKQRKLDKSHHCRICKSDKDLQRHHPSYDNTDVVIFCRSCHNKIHKGLKLSELLQKSRVENI